MRHGATIIPRALGVLGPCVALLVSSVVPGFAQTVDTTLWIANGSVRSLARSGNTLYIGGAFTQLSPATGGGVPVDSTTGTPRSGFPKVAGRVNAVLPDGAGGWYIGGLFTYVRGLPRQNLAHILADHSVSGWNPGTNDIVYALALSAGTVYVGGSFTTAGGQSRNYIAQLDATADPTAWNPGGNAAVYALAVSGTTVYAAGNFTTLGGQARNRIAALDAATGLATPWNPDASAYVSALVVSGTTVYVGGNFATIGGQARNRIAALDATVNTNNATGWNPSADFEVDALVVNGAIVYAGGYFTSIGGQPRNYLAALNVSDGSATTWNPNPNDVVRALVVKDLWVFAGGDFTTIGGQPRGRVAMMDPGTGSPGAWNPGADGTVLALAAGPEMIYVGGLFFGMGGVARHYIAALDVTTGAPTAWNPNASSSVYALGLSGNILYAGGFFTSIGGQPRNHLAALNVSDGNATTWNPGANNGVQALAMRDSTIYAGGLFTTIGGSARNFLGALSPTTGLAMAWNPNANAQIRTLAASGSAVYAGGFFTTMGGQPHPYLAALDVASGVPTAWNPNANSNVLALAVSGGTVYAGGAFSIIGGQARSNIAALDATSGLATSWNPSASGGGVVSLAASGGTVYAGGPFTGIGGQSRNRIAALDATTGAAAAWNPNANSVVNALAVSGATVYAGGDFTVMSGRPQGYLAAITASPAITAIVPSIGGNSGSVSVTISGGGFAAGTTVKLARSAHMDIAGGAVVVAPDALSLAATFNLAGADTGAWNVVVTTPDLQTATLANGFVIAELAAPQLRVSIVGYSIVASSPAILQNHRTAIDLVIENRGNADAYAVPLWLAGIPLDATVELTFTPGYPPHPGGEPDWSTVPPDFISAGGRYLTLVIPRVAPGTTSRRLYLTVPNPPHAAIQLTAAITPPWEDGAVFRSCITGAGITNAACVGPQLAAINAYIAANPQVAAFSGIAVWAKAAYLCEPGAGTFGGAVAKAEQVLDSLVASVESGTSPLGCGDVRLPRWREVRPIGLVGAVDPNDKLGVQGTLSGQQDLPYTIRFENLSTATAHAQRAWVTDSLDATTLDLTTISLGAIRFGDVALSPPPGQSSWSGWVNLPSKNLHVDVTAWLDVFTHQLTWYFNSTLLSTGATPPLNQGFLPPNNAQHEGEGSVQFTIQPKSGLSSGAMISNGASIILNDPPATATPLWQNTLDTAPPSSRVKPLTPPQDPVRYTVQWEPVGTWPDLRDYTIYAREDAGPYWAWRVNTVALSDTFAARLGHSYSFYSRARDNVGNLEAAPAAPDAQYTSPVGVGDGGPPRLTLAGAWPNPARGALRVTFSLASAEAASLELYDVAGRRVLRRSVGALGPGSHVLTVGGNGELRAGLYFLRLSQGGRVLHARVALMR